MKASKLCVKVYVYFWTAALQAKSQGERWWERMPKRSEEVLGRDVNDSEFNNGVGGGSTDAAAACCVAGRSCTGRRRCATSTVSPAWPVPDRTWTDAVGAATLPPAGPFIMSTRRHSISTTCRPGSLSMQFLFRISSHHVIITLRSL